MQNTKPTPDTRIQKEYYPLFDYLRIGCAFAVMAYHAKLFTWGQSGNLAVQIFFALSGWLIGRILISIHPNELYKFYFNRATRIWIPYYLALLIILTLSIFRDPISSKWIEIVLYKLTFVYHIYGTQQLGNFVEQMPLKGTFNHAWSVNAEEQFYLAAPILLVLGARYFGKSLAIWSSLALLSLIFNIYPAITLGVLAAIATNHKNTKSLTSSKKIQATLLSIATISTILTIYPVTYKIASPILSISIVLLLAKPGKKTALSSILGGISYPLYLNHWIGVYAANYLLPKTQHTIKNIILSILISFFVAIILYFFIDKKIIEKRERWHTQARAITITSIAYILSILGIVAGQILT